MGEFYLPVNSGAHYKPFRKFRGIPSGNESGSRKMGRSDRLVN
jgi:hypothetical protein